MYLTWHGHSCFKIIGKTIGNDEVTIVTDPFNDIIGLKPMRCEAHIVTLNNCESEELDVSKKGADCFLIDTPGEYEVKKVYIKGIRAFRDTQQGKEKGVTTLYKIHLEDISILHLGYLACPLTDIQMEEIGKCDVLLLPVGNQAFLNTKDAVKLIGELEPQMVVPMIYQIPGITIECDSIDAFSKEMGLKDAEKLPKLKITKKDLEAEETKIIILEKT